MDMTEIQRDAVIYMHENLPDLNRSLRHIRGVEEDIISVVVEYNVQIGSADWVPVEMALTKMDKVRRRIEKMRLELSNLAEEAEEAMDALANEWHRYYLTHIDQSEDHVS
ncbi:hypothetical protein CIW48_08130 [Methylobacterium sp. P1-11]|uniref:hypothetical protein n=1 Tax=Methylobacterium sp. P1-11 TaxID=2024616 RepID=UPI0011EC986C|nr:hypothetical protein [Methylobacterium sp. P1-11]KAA0124286.1 hypothetical protein CIW48_08130 [Methylobacterium sp. P1-11]